MGVFDNVGNFLFGNAGSAVSDAQKRQQGINTDYASQITKAMSPFASLSNLGQTQNLQQGYISGLSGLDTDQYKVAAPTYDTSTATNAEIQAAVDPNVAYQQEAAKNALESSAAGRGGLFSSGLGKSVATSAEQLGAQAWNQAKADVTAEKDRQNQIAANQFGTNTSAGTYNLGMDQTGVNALGQAYNTMLEPLSAVSQGQMDLANTLYGANAGLNQQQLQSQAANRGYFGDLLGAGVRLFGGK